MMKIILSFKSRSQTLQCANLLKSSGYTALVRDTPISLHGSCTIAVNTNEDGYYYFLNNARRFTAFLGAYSDDCGKITRII